MATLLAGSNAAALRVLSVAIGVFLLFMGIDKVGWLTDDAFLVSRLQEWRDIAPPSSRWYLENVALPGAPVFARLVFLGELLSGMALILGFRTRLAATVSLLMVLNFHFASDVLFHYSYLTNAYGLPVLGSLAAVAIGGSRLPFQLER